MRSDNEIIAYRWSLALGNAKEATVDPEDLDAHQVLNQLYNDKQKESLKRSMPKLHKWNSQLQKSFPTGVVELVQKDAIEKYQLRKLLLDDSYLEKVEPNIGLLSNLLLLKKYFKGNTLNGLYRLIDRMASEMTKKLRPELIRTIGHQHGQTQRLFRLGDAKINWERTLLENLQHYQSSIGTIIPQKFFGQLRRSKRIKRLFILVDQSASMAESLIFASLYASILSKIPSLQTQFVVFDTDVVDLSEYLDDVVELIMQAQLGGGTDISKALVYAAEQMEIPEESILILISDLFDGYDDHRVLMTLKSITAKGTKVICLLALNEQGTPVYNHGLAQQAISIDIPSFACSIDQFPIVMAQALNAEEIQV